MSKLITIFYFVFVHVYFLKSFYTKTAEELIIKESELKLQKFRLLLDFNSEKLLEVNKNYEILMNKYQSNELLIEKAKTAINDVLTANSSNSSSAVYYFIGTFVIIVGVVFVVSFFFPFDGGEAAAITDRHIHSVAEATRVHITAIADMQAQDALTVNKLIIDTLTEQNLVLMDKIAFLSKTSVILENKISRILDKINYFISSNNGFSKMIDLAVSSGGGSS